LVEDTEVSLDSSFPESFHPNWTNVNY
jgi:hypothetical protein